METYKVYKTNKMDYDIIGAYVESFKQFEQAVVYVESVFNASYSVLIIKYQNEIIYEPAGIRE